MQNLFQNGASDISEIANMVNRFYLKKIQNFGSLDFVQILPACGKNSMELRIVF